MIDRNWGKPDFPIVSNPFDNHNIEPLVSTEIESTDAFTVEDIFELGFLRSNPQIRVYKHNTKTDLYLEEKYEVDFSMKDRVIRRVIIFTIPSLPVISKVIYNSTKPNKEDIIEVLKTVV